MKMNIYKIKGTYLCKLIKNMRVLINVFLNYNYER